MADSSLDDLSPALREILDRLPLSPGVYLMKDKKGRIVYVGKAASLRARVRQYFTKSGDNRDFVPLLANLLADIETVVTNNEKEALLLENNLIKKHQPRFNVKLVDDKNYLVLKLDPTARYPRLEVLRRIGKPPARWFGPYHSATAVRAALKVVNRHFKLRTCTDAVLDSRKRPCLQYQIKRCDAPCVFDVPEAEYGEQVRDVTLFLDGKDNELLTRLGTRMRAASDLLEFERAAALRDQIAALQKTLEEQRVVSDDLRDQDVIGFYREGDRVEIAVLFIRGGKLSGRRTWSLSSQEFPDTELLSNFVARYYDQGALIPDEVLLHCSIEDATLKAEWLRDKRGKRVDILTPRRGERARLIDLASKNAAASFHSRRDRTRDVEESLAKLQERLSLKRTPRRIECFDISHIQGTSTVASMVVFLDGEPARAEYRRFKVKRSGNDDFASMYEVLSRRLRRSLVADEGKTWPLPDLIVIDGGKGQLGSALAAVKDVGMDVNRVDVVSLAKERDLISSTPLPTREAPTATGKTTTRVTDRVFLPRIKDPIVLRPNTAELHVLSRVRDEAHRFAITFHGELRRKKSLRSSLSDVEGIGERRVKALLRHFGSLREVRAASVDALAAAPHMSRAAAVAVRRWIDGEGAPVPQPHAEPPSEIAEDAAAEELARLAADEPAPADGGDEGGPVA